MRSSLLALGTAAAALAVSSAGVPDLVRVVGGADGTVVGKMPYHAVDASAARLGARPELIDYDPVADPAAVVVSGSARFTVLTDRLIRMEYSPNATIGFEDRSTIAIMNRKLAVPQFTQSSQGGVLTIQTDKVKLSYTIGQPFSATSLSVTSLDPTSAFTSWAFGDAFAGNLLGTIRGLDQQVRRARARGRRKEGARNTKGRAGAARGAHARGARRSTRASGGKFNSETPRESLPSPPSSRSHTHLPSPPPPFPFCPPRARPPSTAR
jgi:hypothetical protein